jgi:hypothetical protein
LWPQPGFCHGLNTDQTRNFNHRRLSVLHLCSIRGFLTQAYILRDAQGFKPLTCAQNQRFVTEKLMTEKYGRSNVERRSFLIFLSSISLSVLIGQASRTLGLFSVRYSCP